MNRLSLVIKWVIMEVIFTDPRNQVLRNSSGSHDNPIFLRFL